MDTVEKGVALLGQTDGRDKIYKFLGGLFKILATVAAKNNDPRAKTYKAVTTSFATARSLMRIGNLADDVSKLNRLRQMIAAQGLQHSERKRFIEVLRLLCDFCFVLGDHLALLAKHKLIPADAKAITKKATVAQFWCFFLAAVLDLIELRDASQRRAYDERASSAGIRRATLNFSKDAVDVLATAAAMASPKEFSYPQAVAAGALTCVSSTVATYMNWHKIK